MLMYFISRAISNEILRGGVCVLISIMAYLLKNLGNVVLPLCAEIGGVALIWIYFGWMLKKSRYFFKKEAEDEKCITTLVLLTMCFVLFNFVGCLLYPGVSDSYRQLAFSNVLLSLLTGICGTMMLICVAIFIKNCRLLEFLGRNSNTIYGLHFLLLGIISRIIRQFPMFGYLTLLYVLLGSAINIGCLSCYIITKKKFAICYRKVKGEDRK